ncbi:hypothetical protein [Chitinimonas lacunae]|uniref:MAPEG family protein n=1 Tax=Chitinimonas lacunae TaxID=1963018 RepID=A0ABV8MPE6_9NEIS
MNYSFLTAGVLVALAFLAHTFIGVREALSTRPLRQGQRDSDFMVLERRWVQSLCAFQLVTIDLLALAALLIALSFPSLLPARQSLAQMSLLLLLGWGVIWLIQMAALRRPFKDYLVLGQWILWFICAGLLYQGLQAF